MSASVNNVNIATTSVPLNPIGRTLILQVPYIKALTKTVSQSTFVKLEALKIYFIKCIFNSSLVADALEFNNFADFGNPHVVKFNCCLDSNRVFLRLFLFNGKLMNPSWSRMSVMF